MDSRARAELEKVALDDADSGRGRLAKVTALRTLARLDAHSGVSWPVDDDGRFNPMPREWGPADAADSDEEREAWRCGGWPAVKAKLGSSVRVSRDVG